MWKIKLVWEPRVVYRGKYANYQEQDFYDIDWNLWTYEYVKRLKTGIVGILPVTEDNELLLIKQFRIPLGQYIIEAPAWLCEENEEKKVSVKRELEEETGYTTNDIEFLFSTPTSAGLTTEIIDIFLWVNARKMTNVSHVEIDKNEDISLIKIPISEAIKQLHSERKNWTLIDSKVFNALNIYLNR